MVSQSTEQERKPTLGVLKMWGNSFGNSFGFSFGAILLEPSGLRISYFKDSFRIAINDSLTRQSLIDQLERLITTDSDRVAMMAVVDRVFPIDIPGRSIAAQSNRILETNRQDRQ